MLGINSLLGGGGGISGIHSRKKSDHQLQPVKRDSYGPLIDQDELDTQRQQRSGNKRLAPSGTMISSKMSLSDNSNVSEDEEDEEEDDFFFEDNDFGDLEYDMWEGQFHLVSAPPPGENSQTSSISEELVSEDVNQILESLDSCWTSTSNPAQFRHHTNSRGTFNQAANSLHTPKNVFFSRSLSLEPDDDDEVPDLFGPSASLRKSPARQILRQTSLPANLLSRTNSIPPHKPPTATLSRMDSIANKDFNCLYWNGHDLEDVQQLQEQVHGLAESQATTDDRYSKVKQENALLTQKIHMLEENIREVEIRSEERLETERKRNRDALQRVEREKQLEIENYSIRLQTLEKEYGKLEAEAAQLRAQSDRLRQEKAELEDQLSESRYALSEAESRVVKLEDLSKREADRSDQERHSSAQLIEELSKEVEELRSKVSSVTSGVSYGSGSVDIVDSTGGGRDGNLDGGNVNGVTLDSEIRQRVSELDSEVRKLREENRQLTESNEEMQAASLLNRGLEQGKTLLSNIDAAPSSSMSIADELGGMSDFQDMSFGSMSDELDQVKRALKEQQDVNSQLRSYIDGILMNIMEKYPEILEVRK